MKDAGFITLKQLFSEIAGEYSSSSQFLDKLAEAQGRHVSELPLTSTQRMLEIARERGWIKFTEERVVVSVSDADPA